MSGPVVISGSTSTCWTRGEPNAMYHAEDNQEDFLVLAGECRAIVNGEERTLHQWDLLHCPAGTEHVLVGAGSGPCWILMVGATRTGRANPKRRSCPGHRPDQAGRSADGG
jgi:quercetin dioxygenase-like cupin family protein